jgi:hypothetical protein
MGALLEYIQYKKASYSCSFISGEWWSLRCSYSFTVAVYLWMGLVIKGILLCSFLLSSRNDKYQATYTCKIVSEMKLQLGWFFQFLPSQIKSQKLTIWDYGSKKQAWNMSFLTSSYLCFQTLLRIPS